MPQIFWGMTPHQLNLCVQAHNEKTKADKNDMIRLAYTHMQIMRMDVKKIPKVGELLIGYKNPVPAIDEDAIIARMKAYNEQLKKQGNKNG